MDKPKLWIVAGCNGAGKSSFSSLLFDNGLVPFDYDRHFLYFYNRLQVSDIQDKMAHNLAFEELEKQVHQAIEGRSDFCYETNFNSTPLFWPSKFKDEGYELHLIYFILDSVETAKTRVGIRVENGGHFVPENEIKKRYFEGYANLNRHYAFFDSVDVFDCSVHGAEPGFCLSLTNGNPLLKNRFPEFLKDLVPEIAQRFEG